MKKTKAENKSLIGKTRKKKDLLEGGMKANKKLAKKRKK